MATVSGVISDLYSQPTVTIKERNAEMARVSQEISSIQGSIDPCNIRPSKFNTAHRAFAILTHHYAPKDAFEEKVFLFFVTSREVSKGTKNIEALDTDCADLSKVSGNKDLREVFKQALIEANLAEAPKNELIQFLQKKIEQETARLAELAPKVKSRSNCRTFFSCLLKTTFVAMLVIGGLAALGSITNRANSPDTIPLINFEGRVGFFNGDSFVDQFGANPIYCPEHLRSGCIDFIRRINTIEKDPAAELGPREDLEYAQIFGNRASVLGKHITFPVGGELAAIDYAEEIYSHENPVEYHAFNLNSQHHSCSSLPVTSECHETQYLSDISRSATCGSVMKPFKRLRDSLAYFWPKFNLKKEITPLNYPGCQGDGWSGEITGCMHHPTEFGYQEDELECYFYDRNCECPAPAEPVNEGIWGWMNWALGR